MTTAAKHKDPFAPDSPHELTAQQVEICAQAAHEAMYGYARALGHRNTSRWEESPDWQCEQAREFVRAIVAGRHLDTSPNRVEATKRRIAAAVIAVVAASLAPEV